MTKSITGNMYDSGGVTSSSPEESLMNGADKIDLVLTKIGSLETGQANLQRSVVELGNSQIVTNAKVDALSSKFDGFDYKLEGQDKKLEGHDAKIENSRFKIQYWLVGFIVATIILILAILGALPKVSITITELFRVQERQSFLLFVGWTGYCSKFYMFASVLSSVRRLRNMVTRLRIRRSDGIE